VHRSPVIHTTDFARIEALRQDARAIFLAGVEAALPGPLVAAALADATELRTALPVDVLAVGKAAVDMAAAAADTLGPRIRSGLVIAPRADVLPATFHVLEASHPVPDASSVDAGRAALRFVGDASHASVLLVLLSGGASALIAVPADGISLDDYRSATTLLLRAGAPIDELNCVRKHIDLVKGGRLAAASTAQSTLGLVISDVIGNPLDVIGSGPFARDSTTPADALRILQQRGIMSSVPASIVQHLEKLENLENLHNAPHSPDDASFERVRLQVVADHTTALDAAADRARGLGYDVVRRTTPVTGDARAAGARLGAELASTPPSHSRRCIVSSGETVVVVHGDGVGGRNQELALAAALALRGAPGRVLLSAGTDGVDGVTTAAGAIVDGGTVDRMRTAGIDAATALDRNDSHTALSAAGDLLVTGPTGTNVLDLQVLLHDAGGADTA
jgi:glycerate-2-kinase